MMSTHQMHQVEELCDRILLIDRGCNVLYGDLGEIQRRFSGHAVIVQVIGELPPLRGVKEISKHNNAVKLFLEDNVPPQEIFKSLASGNISIEKFEVAIPSLDEIFIQVVGGQQIS